MALPSSPHGRQRLSHPLFVVSCLCISTVLYSIVLFHVNPYNDAPFEADAALVRRRRAQAIEFTATIKEPTADIQTITEVADVEKTLSKHWNWDKSMEESTRRDGIVVRSNEPEAMEHESTNPVNFLFGLSGSRPGFWSEVEVALKSILLNAPVDNDLRIHYMVDEDAYKPLLEMLDRIDIRSWQTRNQVTIRVYNVKSHIETWSERIRNTWHQYNSRKNVFRHSVGAYFRLFAKEILGKDVEHAIYMDSDAVIMADVQEVWRYVDSDKLFQWGMSGLCSGFLILNVQRLDELWEKVPNLDLKKTGRKMKSSPGDQLILRAMNRTYPELVGVLPREWDISTNNGFHGSYKKQYNKATEEEVLDELKQAGMLHFNGGGTSDEAYFNQHKLLTDHQHGHSFGLVQYYAMMPWTWAKFIVETNRRGGTSYTPIVVTGLNNRDVETMSTNGLSHCPPDLTDEQCKAMIPPHTGYKKVLVTGGAGFIGSHVAEFLLARGDDVVIVDEMNDYYDVRIKEANLKLLRDKYPSEKRLSIYRGDICDAEFMAKIFETEKPKWVCHMAARAGVRPSIQDPYIYIQSNIRGTTQLMELSHKHEVQNFVYASSSSVYGGSKSTFFSEQEAVDNPISPYAASKKATELFSYTFHHLYKLNMTGLRFFTVYGPRGRPDMAPFAFIDRVSRGKPIKQFGDGSSSRDYTYISDIVDGIVRSIDRPHKYEVFNLGKGDGTSLKEFIHIVEKHTGKEANVQILPDQPGDVHYTCANVTKAHRLLGYQAKMPFDEGIRRTVEWYNATYLSTP